MAHVKLIDINGETNIGLLVYATDKFALVPKGSSEETIQDVEEVLKVPAYQVSVAGTNLLGVFLNGTNEKILVPEIVYDKELEELQKIGKEHDVVFEVFHTELTCLGNNMLIAKGKAIVNPDYTTKEVEALEAALNIEATRNTIADIEITGAAVVINTDKNRALVHREATNDDIKLIEETFDLESDTGSINMGSPYIKSGIISNKNGFLAGNSSGGPEVNHADQALGYLDN